MIFYLKFDFSAINTGASSFFFYSINCSKPLRQYAY